MTAAQVAEALVARGIQVQDVTEGDRVVDGCVQITEKVSVQVGFYEEIISVTKVLDGFFFKFYQVRPVSDIDGIVADIRKALETHPA